MNLKTTLLLALAGLVAAVLLLVSENPWGQADNSNQVAEKAEKPLFESKPTGIDRVEVVLNDERRVFEKDGEDWKIVEPLQAPANNYQVNNIVDTIGDLKYDRSYAKDDKARPSEAVSGLNRPAVIKLYKGDKLEAEVAVGAQLPTGTGNYIRLAGTEEIREATTDLREILNKRMRDYRDKRVVKFNTNDVRQVKVEGAQNYVLVKDGADWVIESPVRARADKSKVEALIRPLSNLYVQEWQQDEPKSYAPYRLDPPQLKVTIETEEEVPAKYMAGDPAATQPADTQPSRETRTYTIMVGGATGGSGATSYFARLDSAPWVFSLAEYTVKDLNKPLSELQDRALARIERAKIQKIEVQTGGENLTLTKGAENQWSFADGTLADEDAVDDLINAVANMKATNFVDPRTQLIAQDWSRPRARVALTVEGRLEPVTLLVGGATPSGRMVYVRNAAEDPIAAVGEELVEPLLLPPISYRDRLVLSVPRERVSKLEIERSGGPKITLSKEGATWSMQSPIKAPADHDSIRNVLGDISTLKARHVAGTGDRARFGLDKPEITLAVWIDRVTDLPNAKVVGKDQASTTQPAATQPAKTKPASEKTAATQPARRAKTIAEQIKDIETLLEYQRTHPETENKKATEMLQEQLAELKARAATQPASETQPAVAAAGEPAGATAQSDASANAEQLAGPVSHRIFLARKDGKIYAALDDGPMIWEVDTRIYDDLSAEMHDRQLTRFEVADVVELSFEGSDTALTFRKAGEEWRYVQDPLLPVDKQKITDALNDIRELKTHRYVDYTAQDQARYGLGDDARRIIVALADGQKTEIRLSKTGPSDDPDESRYAQVADAKKVFLLKPDQARKLERKLADFEKSDKPAGSPTT